MTAVQMPGKWNFLIGEPDPETPLGKMAKGIVEVTQDKLNAYKEKDLEIVINVRDIKKITKETKRGTLMVKIVGRNKQVYTFIPLSGGTMEKTAMADQLVQALQNVIPPPPT